MPHAMPASWHPAGTPEVHTSRPRAPFSGDVKSGGLYIHSLHAVKPRGRLKSAHVTPHGPARIANRAARAVRCDSPIAPHARGQPLPPAAGSAENRRQRQVGCSLPLDWTPTGRSDARASNPIHRGDAAPPQLLLATRVATPRGRCCFTPFYSDWSVRRPGVFRGAPWHGLESLPDRSRTSICPCDHQVSQQPFVEGDVSLQPLTVREQSGSLMKWHGCWSAWKGREQQVVANTGASFKISHGKWVKLAANHQEKTTVDVFISSPCL